MSCFALNGYFSKEADSKYSAKLSSVKLRHFSLVVFMGTNLLSSSITLPICRHLALRKLLLHDLETAGLIKEIQQMWVLLLNASPPRPCYLCFSYHFLRHSLLGCVRGSLATSNLNCMILEPCSVTIASAKLTKQHPRPLLRWAGMTVSVPNSTVFGKPIVESMTLMKIEPMMFAGEAAVRVLRS